MTKDKLLEVIKRYETLLNDLGVDAKAYPHNAIVVSKKNKLAHISHMLIQIKIFIAEDRIEKAFRWLGFVQGILWSEGLYKLEDLKKHNMPT